MTDDNFTGYVHFYEDDDGDLDSIPDEGPEKPEEYTYPDGTSAGLLTWEQARKEGFCPGCGYFVLGSGDDYTMPQYGLCSECVAELKYETGESDEDDDDYEDDWY